MSAEIQPKKIRLAEIWDVFFPSQPNFKKKFSLGVYTWKTFSMIVYDLDLSNAQMPNFMKLDLYFTRNYFHYAAILTK